MIMKRMMIVALLTLAGACSKSTDTAGQDFGLSSLFDPVGNDPVTGTVVPFPFDGLFAGFNDPTLNIPNPNAAPFVDDANRTDGFSTTASIFTDLLGFADYASADEAVIIINTSTGARLTVGVDYRIQPSAATTTVADLGEVPLDRQRTRLLIEPLRPLSPSTTYLVAVTTALKTDDGHSAAPSSLYKVVSSAVAVEDQTEPVLATLNDAQKGTLELLRSSLIRPAVEGLLAAYNLAHNPDLTEGDLVIAWPFTTQSVGKSLAAVNTAAKTADPLAIGVADTTLSTGDLGLGLADTADIYAGSFTLPYYLDNADASPLAPLGTFWAADATQPDTSATFLGQVPCGAFATGFTLPDGQTAQPSVSTTTCYPVPVKKSDETIPLLVTVPNANSAGGGVKPETGWPVVIFQHGITRNRTDMLALAPTLAAAGFVVVSIDLPLHGLPPGDPSRVPGVEERTFDLDLADNATGAAGSDGTADASGTHFINLTSVITSRDNLRQGVADLIHLAQNVGALDFDGGGGDIDTSRIHFVGQSLGGIVGTVLMGVDGGETPTFGAASLHVPGGGIAKLLDASVTFGPRIAAGLAGNGVIEGTDTYETFIRFAQHLTDPGDPVNYAATASANHPIHLVQVAGDTVVPNSALAGPASATQDLVTISGFLSGTDPLVTLMGLAVVGPITAPGTGGEAGANTAVLFATGDHGSLLDPTADAATTCEMQRQTASFFATGGTAIPYGGTCP